MLAAADLADMVEVGIVLADNMAADCKVAVDNCSVKVGILLNSSLHFFYPNAYPNIHLVP